MLHSAGWAKGLEEALAVFSMLVLMIQQRADPFELWPSSGWELKGVTPKFLSKAVNCYALCSAGLLLDGKPLGQHHSHFRQTEVSPHCQTLTNWLKLVQNQLWVPSRNGNSIIFYSLPCPSKPEWLTFKQNAKVMSHFSMQLQSMGTEAKGTSALQWIMTHFSLFLTQNSYMAWSKMQKYFLEFVNKTRLLEYFLQENTISVFLL